MSTIEPSLNRRDFLGVTAALGFTRASPSPATADGQGARGEDRPNRDASLDDNIYTRLLGIRPHLGAHEHISRLGGGRMSRDVLNAMAEANDYFVDMRELNAAAGRRVAELFGAEAAMITAGGFSGMILGAAACLTGTDRRGPLRCRTPRGSGVNVSFRPRRSSITIAPIEPPARPLSTPTRKPTSRRAWARALRSSRS